jgi:ABC-type phosphate transport system permease subunit
MYKICFITLLITNIPFAIIIGVALQEYKEYNNLPHGISGTTQCLNKCLKH